MTIVEVFVIGLGGFFGAIIRFLVAQKLNADDGFPFGTLIVNLAGSFLIGLIVGVGLPKIWMFLLVAGFMGALTTFSTVQKEVIERWRNGQRKQAISYIVLTYGGGLLLAMLGYLLVT